MLPQKKLPPGTAWAPADWESADVFAIQALQNGSADQFQQKRALDWIIKKAAATYEFHYSPSERDTAFALGRAHVGQQIVKLLALPAIKLAPASIRREEHDHRSAAESST
jgi:hypothetical protein